MWSDFLHPHGALPQLEKIQKMLLNYDTTWWMFWNYFLGLFIVGLNGENFSEAEFSKFKTHFKHKSPYVAG